MSFYDTLSKYYDIVFPLNKDTLNMLEKNFKDKVELLDVACGSGSYSLALQDLGHNVTAIDLDSTMIQKLKEKNHGNIHCRAMNMLHIDKLEKKFQGIFCIGNSLVHLNNQEEIGLFFKKVYQSLENQGVFIFQIINYDRILRDNVQGLPTIEKPEAGLSFERKYSLLNGKIHFKGIISLENGESFENVVELYPLQSHAIITELVKAGFKTYDLFGSFTEAPYRDESMATVVVARKG